MITLAFLVLITVLAIGIFTATRMEVAASRLHYDGIRADFYAKAGEGIALARLLQGTSGTNRAWVSQPGRLVTSPTNAPFPVTNAIDLHSGSPDGLSSNDVVDLNPSRFASPAENLILPEALFAGTNASVSVRWIYSRKDGSFDTNASPAYNGTNPVVGRLAFWVDDESTKVNLNTAWTRRVENTNPAGHPSRIDLGAVLGNSTASEVNAFRDTNRFFNSPLDFRQTAWGGNPAALTNAGSLTHYSHSPDLNLFGEKRIVLTTQKRLAGTNEEFLDILRADNIDPGDINNLDYAKVDAAVKKIVRRLDRDSWPFFPGKKFTDKYSSPYQDWAWQIGSNIIEFVRCRESTNEVVDPIRYRQVTTARLNSDAPGDRIANASGDYYLGTARAPMITEVGVWFSRSAYPSGANQGLFAVQYLLELFLPEGTGEINLENDCLLSVSMFNKNASPYPNGAAFPAVVFNVPIRRGPPPATPDNACAYLDGNDPVLHEGTYRTVTHYRDAFGVSAANGFNKAQGRPTDLAMKVSILRTPSSNPLQKITLSGAPAYLSGVPDASFLTYHVDAPPPAGELPLSSITSLAVIDPFLGKHFLDWKQGPNTFGMANPNPPQSYAGPQQDTDSSGNVVTNSARIPARKGSARNPRGIVESVAELGWVHTGITSYPPGAQGVPWRTLRLQPQRQGSTDFPDWAVLDLFSVPVDLTDSERSVIRPIDRATGGKVNLNLGLLPFDASTNSSPPVRKPPMNALLSGVKKDGSSNALSPSAIDSIRENLRTRTLAGASGNQGTQYGSGPSVETIFTPAQIVEYSGVADRGEASEAVLREILDVAAARSSVFAIYSIGQAISQDGSGAIRILAEARTQRIVELTSPNASTTGGFNTVFSRRLLP